MSAPFKILGLLFLVLLQCTIFAVARHATRFQIPDAEYPLAAAINTWFGMIQALMLGAVLLLLLLFKRRGYGRWLLGWAMLQMIFGQILIVSGLDYVCHRDDVVFVDGKQVTESPLRGPRK